MRDLGLPARIRAKGVPVVLVAGWDSRGNATGFNPIGSVNHHTAGSSRGATPSLSTNIYGRPDVPGPLCNVMQSREANAIDKAYVIASGKANHGGVGTWSGPGGTMNSNYESFGLEIEHTGTSTVPVARLETAARIQAAFLEATPTRSAGMCCQHSEYARPVGRKIDFFDLAPYNRNTFRDRVRFWIGRTVDTPPPVPVPEEEEDMPFIVTNPRGQALLIGSDVAHAMGMTATSKAEYRKEGFKEINLSEEEFDRYERLPRG